MHKTILPAKLIRPDIADVLLRERLFKKIDRLRARPTIWVSAPGGAGKTSLVSSYIESRSVPCIWYQLDNGDEDPATFFHFLGLAGKCAARSEDKVLPRFTPEYFFGIEGFSRYFFTELCDILPSSSMLVFDNCQEISEYSGLFDTILAGQARMNVDMNIIFICRKGVPALFSRQSANRTLGKIEWEDLRFTRMEFKEFAVQLGIELDGNELQQAYDKLDGWAAGLPLLYDTDIFRLRSKPSFDLTENEARGPLFDYFAREIYEYLDTESQEILLKTSLLPYVDKPLAELVCESRGAFTILQKLYRSNIFISLRTKPHELYQFHQLFKEFLVERCRLSMSAATMNTLRCSAARSLVDNGQIEEAATLFIEANELPALKRLIIDEAAGLLKQGRFQTLAGWLQHLPESMQLGDPWLLYWKGMCLMLHDPLRARLFLIHALEIFEYREDKMGLYTTMLGVGDSLSYGFDSFSGYDRWIEKMETLLSDEPFALPLEIEARIALIMLAAIAMRQPGHPRAKSWRNKVVGFFENSRDFEADLRTQLLIPIILHSILTGSLPQARLFMDSFKSLTQASGIPPLVILTLKNFEALYQWRCGNAMDCHTAVDEALRLSEATGIHIISSMLLLNGASGALIAGNVKLAKEYLDKVEGNLYNAGAYVKQLYHLSLGWRSLLDQNHTAALAHCEKSVQFGLESGNHEATSCSFLAYAMAMHLAKSNDKIKELIEQSLISARKAASPYVKFASLLFKAYFLFSQDDNENGLKVLQKALILGRKNDYYCFPLWRASLVEELCSKALEADLEVEYVWRLIERRQLKIKKMPVMPESLPWPLRIYCLGQFDIERKNRSVKSAQKTGQKPFTILKALIAAGGRQVPVSALAQFLWPEADGDMQIQNFNTTLHRLRKSLGVKDALILQSGQLTLNDNYCWVDMWKFERLVKDVDQKLEKDGTAHLDVASAEEAVSLFQGPFLDSAPEAWAIPVRERLNKKFVGLVEKLSIHHYLTGDWDKATECCKRGLASAPLEEELYHRMMLCQKQAGQRTAALQTYEIYKRLLVSPMGISPSEKMKTLYNEIKSGN